MPGIRVAVFVSAAFLFTGAVFAQDDNNQHSGDSNTPPSPGWTAGSDQAMPIHITGRVIVDDGTVPNNLGRIELACGGQSRAKGYTDTAGRFGFELGDSADNIVQDATQDGHRFDTSNPWGGLDPAGPLLSDCALRAALPGYQSEDVSLAGRGHLRILDIGAIIVHRLGVVEGTVVSATTLAAPRSAQKAFQKGMAAARRNKPEDAVRNLQQAVSIYPQYALAWCALGGAQFQEKHMDDAARSFRSAIQADPRFLEPYAQLAGIEAASQQWKDLAATTGRALELDPYGSYQMYFLNALAHYQAQEFDAAAKSAREAERIDAPHRFPKTWELLGAILEKKGDFGGAAEQYRSYLTYAPTASDAPRLRTELERLLGSAGVK